uniref:Putative secreted protein n=1 Tax=Anopheles darlingi TaxID=43151 RepID=A0A2M4DD81_ANODA
MHLLRKHRRAAWLCEVLLANISPLSTHTHKHTEIHSHDISSNVCLRILSNSLAKTCLVTRIQGKGKGKRERRKFFLDYYKCGYDWGSSYSKEARRK